MDHDHSPSPDNDKAPEQTQSGGLASFWAELKRRKVMRVAITYAVVAWLIIQVANATFESFGIPDWAYRFVVIMLGIFFPVAVILAWAFELTPDGIKTTKHAREEQGDAPVSKQQQRKRNWFSLLFAAAVPTLIFGTLALVFYFQAKPGQETSSSTISDVPSTISDKSIAVLPLENMSPDEENAFFADGVQEDILTNLSKIQALHVISRSSTLQYRNPDRNLKQIGSELGARFIVEGSVRRAGDQVRVTAQLIDTQTDKHLWAENFNRRLDDIFAIQAEIAKEIAQQLQATISPNEIERIEKLPTKNQTAYDLFVRAREIERSTGNLIATLDESDRMISYLETAVSLDPEFASAYALLSSVFCERSVLRGSDDKFSDPIGQGREAAEKAEALDPFLPEVHLAWGNYYYNGFLDYDRAEKEFLKALALQPGSADGYSRLGVIQRRQGRYKEAIVTWEKALTYDPRNPNLLSDLAMVHARFRRYRMAESFADRLLSLDPENARFRRVKGMASFWRSGDIRHRLAELEAYRTLNSSQLYTKYFPDYYSEVARGDFAAALAIAESWEDPGNAVDLVWAKPRSIAIAAWNLGDYERAKNAARATAEALETFSQTDLRDFQVYSSLAVAYAMLRDLPKVEHYRKMAVESLIGTRDEHQSKFGVQEQLLPSYLILGETDEALSRLDELLSQPSNIHAAEIRIDPFWHSFNGDPRFEAILAKAKSVD